MITYSTGEASKILKMHPNTIRLYEKNSLVPKIHRKENGYRIFKKSNLDDLRIAWLSLRFTWLSGPVRRTALKIIELNYASNYKDAYAFSLELKSIIQNEIIQARQAVYIVELWLSTSKKNKRKSSLDLEKYFLKNEHYRITDISKITGTTPDMIRNWEKNNILFPNRNPDNKYRLFGLYDAERIVIIRMLKKAGYSTMSILRMFLKIDSGSRKNLIKIINTPESEEDIVSAADKWIHTLDDLLKLSRKLTAALKARI